MRLSTSVSLFYDDTTGRNISTMESMRRCASAGFKVLDMDFSPILGGKEFVGNDWEKQAYAIRETAEAIGVNFSQALLPFYPENMCPDAECHKDFAEYMRRSAIISGILGVKWAVGYPYAHYDGDIYNNDLDLSYNLELYKPILEELNRNGVGLAFENITHFKNPVKRRYTATAEELCELVDAFHDNSVSACWNFGNGNRMYKDQALPLRVIGKRLHATHLNDNAPQSDSHTLPFIGGNIKWETCLPVLTEIGYDGDLTVQIDFAYGLPDALKDSLARLAFTAGNYCLKIAEGGTL